MYCILDKERFNHVVDFYWVVWRILWLTAHVQLAVDIKEVSKNGTKCRNNAVTVLQLLVLQSLLSHTNEIILQRQFYLSALWFQIITDFIGGCKVFCCPLVMSQFLCVKQRHGSIFDSFFTLYC